MAIPNYTNVTFPYQGLIKGGTDPLAMYLKIFSGEVLTAFTKSNLFLGKTKVRTITSGKSAQFPVIGTASAAYFKPGDKLTGTSIDHFERTISIEGLVIAHTFVVDLLDKMNHYEVRGEYANQLGIALAEQVDKNILGAILGAYAANTGVKRKTLMSDTATVTDGHSVFETTTGTVANLVDYIKAAAKKMDKDNIPKTDRWLFLDTDQYYLLFSNLDLINQWYKGQGSIAEGDIMKLFGFSIIEYNMPVDFADDKYYIGSTLSEVVTGSVTKRFDLTTLSANFVGLAGIAFHPSCVGTVQLMGIQSESDYDITTQGSWLVSKYAMGHGILRPESVYAIFKQTTP